MKQPDWTGSSSQRKSVESFYPHAKPTPKEKLYRIAQGSDVLIKSCGDKNWRRYTTTKDLVFFSTYAKSDKSLTFFCAGYLLCAKREIIREE